MTRQQLKAGARFGSLTVLKRDAKRHNSEHAYYLCACDCGREYVARGALLKDGTTTQCRTCSSRQAVANRQGVSQLQQNSAADDFRLYVVHAAANLVASGTKDAIPLLERACGELRASVE